MTLPLSDSSAVFSPCRKWRYELWRRWGSGSFCMFIGLNPSTADETLNDPTIRRCIRYAQDWGYGALCMTNAFAWRATDPRDMKAAAEPVGKDNDATLVRLSGQAGVVVAAWGVHCSHNGRESVLRSLIRGLHCLQKTKGGFPAHPLYLPANLKPVPYLVEGRL